MAGDMFNSIVKDYPALEKSKHTERGIGGGLAREFARQTKTAIILFVLAAILTPFALFISALLGLL